VENVFGDNGNDQNNPGGEGQLDIEYLMALAPGAETFYYSFSDLSPYNTANEGFLAYLYFVGNETNPALVHSLSYGDIEQVLSHALCFSLSFLSLSLSLTHTRTHINTLSLSHPLFLSFSLCIYLTLSPSPSLLLSLSLSSRVCSMLLTKAA
jgi:hypothetical protein